MVVGPSLSVPKAGLVLTVQRRSPLWPDKCPIYKGCLHLFMLLVTLHKSDVWFLTIHCQNGFKSIRTARLRGALSGAGIPGMARLIEPASRGRWVLDSCKSTLVWLVDTGVGPSQWYWCLYSPYFLQLLFLQLSHLGAFLHQVSPDIRIWKERGWCHFLFSDPRSSCCTRDASSYLPWPFPGTCF